MEVLVWTLVGFLSGSIPFSILIGWLARGVDIRAVGDHNPGAANVFRSSGVAWGVAAMLLDAFKGAVPVGLAWFFWHIRDTAIIPVALAPVFGHAFSPWLRFRGGKAVATTFGIWAGLTLGVVPVVLGILLTLMYKLLSISGWALMLSFVCLGIFVASYYGSAHPEFVWIWLGNFLLLGWKHREDLLRRPSLRRQTLQWLLRRG